MEHDRQQEGDELSTAEKVVGLPFGILIGCGFHLFLWVAGLAVSYLVLRWILSLFGIDISIDISS